MKTLKNLEFMLYYLLRPRGHLQEVKNKRKFRSQRSLRRQTRALEMFEFRDEIFHFDDVAFEICVAVPDWLLLTTEFSRESITSNQRPCTNHYELRYQKKSFTLCSKVLEYGIHYRSTSKMLRPLVCSSV